jgi:undecaprenyl-phosphate 4-deoxy-4-formamido-L-arabinose transferase
MTSDARGTGVPAEGQAGPVHSRSLSIVIPAYRSAATLPGLCEELLATVRPLVTELEIVLIDDASPDDTWSAIVSLATKHTEIRGIQMFRNYGQHNALLAGLRMAKFPLVLTMDDDGQHPPSQVPTLLSALTDDVDLVYGSPQEERHGVMRNLASRSAKQAMAGALGRDVYPRSGAFRLFRQELVSAADDVHDPAVSIDVILSWATTRIVDVDVQFEPRRAGSSGYGVTRLIRHALNMITGYSTRPLRWVSAAGLVCAVIGFLLLLYVLIRFFAGGTDVAGFTFLAAAVTLFSGVQLLSLGVVGEYLGRMHFRSMGKPNYVIRAQTEAPDPRSRTTD